MAAATTLLAVVSTSPGQSQTPTASTTGIALRNGAVLHGSVRIVGDSVVEVRLPNTGVVRSFGISSVRAFLTAAGIETTPEELGLNPPLRGPGGSGPADAPSGPSPEPEVAALAAHLEAVPYSIALDAIGVAPIACWRVGPSVECRLIITGVYGGVSEDAEIQIERVVLTEASGQSHAAMTYNRDLPAPPGYGPYDPPIDPAGWSKAVKIRRRILMGHSGTVGVLFPGVPLGTAAAAIALKISVAPRGRDQSISIPDVPIAETKDLLPEAVTHWVRDVTGPTSMSLVLHREFGLPMERAVRATLFNRIAVTLLGCDKAAEGLECTFEAQRLDRGSKKGGTNLYVAGGAILDPTEKPVKIKHILTDDGRTLRYGPLRAPSIDLRDRDLAHFKAVFEVFALDPDQVVSLTFKHRGSDPFAAFFR